MTWDFARHVAVFNRAVESREWGELVDLFAPDATMDFVGPPVGSYSGREAIAAAYAADGPDDTIELTGPTTRAGEQDTVTFRWRASGQTGSMRAESTGERLDRLVVVFD